MDDDRFPYDEIRHSVEARFKRRKRFVQAVALWLLVNIGLGVWTVRSHAPIPFVLFAAGLTFLPLLAMWVNLLMNNWQERVIDRETERRWQQYLSALQYLEKPKRDEESFSHLMDDGELADEYDDLKQKRVR